MKQPVNGEILTQYYTPLEPATQKDNGNVRGGKKGKLTKLVHTPKFQTNGP